MKLAEIAGKINAHLIRFEADPVINRTRPGTTDGKRFFYAGAWTSGRYVSIRYISYQGISNMSKEQALAYLAAMDGGSTDRHFDALRDRPAETVK